MEMWICQFIVVILHYQLVDEKETVYYNNQIKNSNGNPYFPYSFNQTILPTDKFATDSNTTKFTAEGSNKIKQNNSSASFSVKPYWNEKSFTLKVVNDFIVEMLNGTTYTIKADDYTDIPETGLNLFTDEAKNTLKVILLHELILTHQVLNG